MSNLGIEVGALANNTLLGWHSVKVLGCKFDVAVLVFVVHLHIDCFNTVLVRCRVIALLNVLSILPLVIVTFLVTVVRWVPLSL